MSAHHTLLQSIDAHEANDTVTSCENEAKLCLDESGSFLDPIEYVLSAWHKECNTFITFSPTTPSLVSLTTSYNSEACIAVESACVLQTSIVNSCLSAYTVSTQAADLNSCFCQERAISLASVCEYDGNKTCLATTAAFSNIPVWSLCPVSRLSCPLQRSTDKP